MPPPDRATVATPWRPLRRGAWRAATQTDTAPETDTQTTTRLAPPWNVVVHDDPVTTMVYVVRVFMEIFDYGRPKAHELMMEVHTTGRAVVWTGDREQAELFVHKLHGKHLLAHLEQSDADS
ncbi:MAG: ATP-dependent Clp protease adaptor ClpS [Planctomycetes bacterium]|nr:ATP-dependent Clp protease adaptor ClpS [Planctomycetota bacterium]MCB9870007.1 ATP-dependent Clp protease adaptor ClpS [Planctomycetota bacterium]